MTTDTAQAVKQAEAAWLVALTDGEEAMSALMLDDSHVVHGPIGKIDDRESFTRFASTRRRTVFAKAEELSITVRGNTAITTCLQEMHIIFDEDLPPFPIQEAVTRVWEETPGGWRLAHMHQAKRMPPV
jgi:ketosteroid isomerase-like protein